MRLFFTPFCAECYSYTDAMKIESSSHAARLVTSVHETYGVELHRYLMRHLPKSADAGDLAQEVYLRLLRLNRSELVRKPIAYVYVIASQVAAQFRMRNDQDPVTYDSDAVAYWGEHPIETAPDEVGEQVNAERQLQQLLNLLPAMHREVLLLRKRDGLSWVEISRQLDISVHTVKKYQYEARARLSASRSRP